jgi:hypothetical protein
MANSLSFPILQISQVFSRLIGWIAIVYCEEEAFAKTFVSKAGSRVQGRNAHRPRPARLKWAASRSGSSARARAVEALPHLKYTKT